MNSLTGVARSGIAAQKKIPKTRFLLFIVQNLAMIASAFEMTLVEEVVLSDKYSIRVYKEYFNFACAHFLIFSDGSREPLHGHNYRVRVAGRAQILADDMVFDFLKIKPLVRKICDSLDHKVILPGNNEQLTIREEEMNYLLSTPDMATFSFPKSDVLILPLNNTSAERFAIYIADQLKKAVLAQFNYVFNSLEVEVEETIGQSATVSIVGE